MDPTSLNRFFSVDKAETSYNVEFPKFYDPSIDRILSYLRGFNSSEPRCINRALKEMRQLNGHLKATKKQHSEFEKIGFVLSKEKEAEFNTQLGLLESVANNHLIPSIKQSNTLSVRVNFLASLFLIFGGAATIFKSKKTLLLSIASIGLSLFCHYEKSKCDRVIKICFDQLHQNVEKIEKIFDVVSNAKLPDAFKQCKELVFWSKIIEVESDST